jgi:hypothetical protein
MRKSYLKEEKKNEDKCNENAGTGKDSLFNQRIRS